MVNNPGLKYYLANDIDFSEAIIKPISLFSGYLDGEGHALTNFKFNNVDNATSFSIFGINNGTIKNLKIDGIEGRNIGIAENLGDSQYLSLLTTTNNGTIDNVSIDNCTIEIKASHKYMERAYSNTTYASLFASVNKGTISNVSASNNTVTIESHVVWGQYQDAVVSDRVTYRTYGGLVASLNEGIIDGVTIESGKLYYKVTSHQETEWQADVDLAIYGGGVIGLNKADVSHVNSNVEVTQLSVVEMSTWGDSNYSYYIGGLMSRNEGNISSCQIGGKAFIEELYHNIDKSDVAQYVSGVTAFNTKNITTTSCSASVGGENVNELAVFVDENSGSITNSYVSQEAQILKNKSLSIGGFAHINIGTIETCYSGARITTGTPNGQCATFAYLNKYDAASGTIRNCFAVGGSTIELTRLYHFVHNDAIGNITNCYDYVDFSGGGSATYMYDFSQLMVSDNIEMFYGNNVLSFIQTFNNDVWDLLSNKLPTLK